MAVKVPPSAPPPAYTWTGFYAGLNAGYAWGWTTVVDEFATNNLCWSSCGGWDAKTKGFTGGGQIGYNLQSGQMLIGLEAEVGYLGLRGSGNYSLLPTTVVNTKGREFTTVRGRLGAILPSNLLVYVTDGYFGADFDSTIATLGGAPVSLFNVSNTGFQSGWTAGVGAEIPLMNRWSVKAEYLYYEVGGTQVDGNFTGGGATVQFFKINSGGGLACLGLNYHFN